MSPLMRVVMLNRNGESHQILWCLLFHLIVWLMMCLTLWWKTIPQKGKSSLSHFSLNFIHKEKWWFLNLYRVREKHEDNRNASKFASPWSFLIQPWASFLCRLRRWQSSPHGIYLLSEMFYLKKAKPEKLQSYFYLSWKTGHNTWERLSWMLIWCAVDCRV